MSVRKVLFWLHLFAGVLAGIIILVMSVTGLVLAYERQIVASADGITVKPKGGDQLPISALLAKVRESHSNAVPSAIVLRSAPEAPAAFSFGKETTLFVDPYTGDLLGKGAAKTRAFFGTVVGLHRWLGAEGEGREVGKAITGASNLIFLFLVLSGVILWFPRKWSVASLKAITLFRGGLKGKARDWNWHNVIGFWSALPLVLIVASGVVISYPWASDLVYRLTGSEPPPARPSASANVKGSGSREGGKGGAGKSDKTASNEFAWEHCDKMWSKAQSEVSAWNMITVRMPSNSQGPFVFSVDKGNGARPDLRTQLTFDAKSGELTLSEPYATQSLGRQVRAWIRWIHTGEAGGLIGQTIAALASAGAIFLVWTGLALSWRRFFGKTPEPSATSSVAGAAEAVNNVR